MIQIPLNTARPFPPSRPSVGGRLALGMGALLLIPALAACVTTPPEGETDLGLLLLARIQNGSDGSAAGDPTGTATTEALKALVESGTADASTRPQDAALVQAFYAGRGFAPAWTDGTGPTARGQAVRDVLVTAWADAIPDIAVPPVPEAEAGAPVPPAAVARHDLAVTRALATYAGRALQRRVVWAPRIPDGTLGALREIAAENPAAEPPGRLFRLVSDDDRTARLRRGLLRYHALAEGGGWPRVNPDGAKIEPGDRHPDVPLIRARLAVTGDLTDENAGPSASAAVDPTLLDPVLAAAVRRFQARHGLAIDGKVGPQTRAAMAMPADRRLRQMALNLKRLRALPPLPDGRSIEVNIAGAALEGRQDGETVFRTDVIVGMRDRPTPELRSAINQLVLNPTWTVPTSIAEKDILPKLRNDPTYLTSHGFQVFEGWTGGAAELDPSQIDWHAPDVDIRGMRLRQAPGPGNALGEIKFLFPNDHDVYLHSTPSRGLFARSTRTFSSGCVRVRDPLDLATFILDDPGTWTAETLRDRIRAGGTRTVRPGQSIPVSIIYLTAWVAEDGTIHFRRDVYGTDAGDLSTVADLR
ncbi:L,D-transpeptidase family protein [Roseospira navarrensis]|nr:L,D-transpeptidase family protein [Roseospira navarrensis]